MRVILSSMTSLQLSAEKTKGKMKMITKAQRIMKILEENYLNICKVQIDNKIVELDESITYLIGNPNKAIRTSFLIKKDEVKYIEESITDIFNYLIGGFRTVIVNNEEYTSDWDKITCLLVF